MASEIIPLFLLLTLICAAIWFGPYEVNFDEEDD